MVKRCVFHFLKLPELSCYFGFELCVWVSILKKVIVFAFEKKEKVELEKAEQVVLES